MGPERRAWHLTESRRAPRAKSLPAKRKDQVGPRALVEGVVAARTKTHETVNRIAAASGSAHSSRDMSSRKRAPSS